MEQIAPILDWLSAHSAWAGLAVFFIALGESLALVGLFLPGAALMFGIGALVGSGALELTPTLIWAAFGAIAGDGISFWLGRHYQDRIHEVWPFNRHPYLLTSATNFFIRHGGKSVAIGRFIGPIRPVIPLVAGMMRMPPRRFLAVNIISGIFWAPVYILPGALFTTTLGLAAEVAARLAIAGGLLIVVAMLAAWLWGLLLNWIHPHAHNWVAQLLNWSRLHPLLGEVPAALLNPEHPEARGITMLALIALGTVALALLLVHQFGHPGLLINLDHYLHSTLMGLRSEPMDPLLGFFSHIAEPRLLGTAALLFALYLFFQGNRAAAAHWSVAIGFTLLLWGGLSLLPSSAHTQSLSGDAPFPSGHILLGGSFYGFLALMAGHEMRRDPRYLYTTVAGLIALVALSRLYFGVNWASSVLASLLIATTWVALLGLAYRRHVEARVAPGAILIIFTATLLVAPMLPIHEPAPSVTAGEAQQQRIDWHGEEWRQLPTWRGDLRGYRSHPLNLHYLGDLQPLRQQLRSAGWQEPVAVTLGSWLNWYDSRLPLAKRPVLPQVHNGENEELLLIRSESEQSLTALRLWRSDYVDVKSGSPVWMGNVSRLEPIARLGMLVPKTVRAFDESLAQLSGTLEGPLRYGQREEVNNGWSGRVLLLEQPVDVE